MHRLGNNTKYSKNKQHKTLQNKASFSCFLRHLTRKQGGLILQCSRADTGPAAAALPLPLLLRTATNLHKI